ncbi:hypothetical protein PanWU01x14_240440 [Parasponia andersonii]|uniref:Uncharacterized protein n=1 Tax=Parasponia andersonii TaxID=3476 RepID=A0A2P5BGQ4_PARAD|nr:hypothetical protein PanWU01x14_240440 [Parasponia andersonii]
MGQTDLLALGRNLFNNLNPNGEPIINGSERDEAADGFSSTLIAVDISIDDLRRVYPLAFNEDNLAHSF